MRRVLRHTAIAAGAAACCAVPMGLAAYVEHVASLRSAGISEAARVPQAEAFATGLTAPDPIADVPEPSSAALLGMALLALWRR